MLIRLNDRTNMNVYYVDINHISLITVMPAADPNDRFYFVNVAGECLSISLIKEDFETLMGIIGSNKEILGIGELKL